MNTWPRAGLVTLLHPSLSALVRKCTGKLEEVSAFITREVHWLGNTYIIKPSEIDPGATMILAALAKEAGLPDGVLNVVHGTKETVPPPLLPLSTTYHVVRCVSCPPAARSCACAQVEFICDDSAIRAVSFVGWVHHRCRSHSRSSSIAWVRAPHNDDLGLPLGLPARCAGQTRSAGWCTPGPLRMESAARCARRRTGATVLLLVDPSLTPR